MQTAISKEKLAHLSKHLEVIKGEKKETLEQYFTKSPSERNEFSDFIDNYVEYIEKFVESANDSETVTPQTVPFIFIGCDVEVEDLDNPELITYHLIDPLQGRVKENDVSYLSPVGKALLLKKAGDKIKVQTPGGTIRYLIKSIQFQG